MMDRRTLLATAGGSALLAGCLDTGLADGPDDGSDEQLSDSIDTLGSDCATDDHEWAVAIRNDDAIVLDGSTPAPDPCHDATVASIDVEDGTLAVEVGVAANEDSEATCAQCTGAVRYTLTVDPGDHDVDAVDLVHGEGEPFAPDLIDVGDPTTIASTDVETVGVDSQPGDTAGVMPRGPAIDVAGTIPAPTPCHLATLEDATVSDGELRLEIGLEKDEEADTCAQVECGIEYVVSIELDGPPFITDLRVDHLDGEVHDLTVER